MMKNYLKILVVLSLFIVANACASKKSVVSKEKKEKIDRDKKNYEKNMDKQE